MPTDVDSKSSPNASGAAAAPAQPRSVGTFPCRACGAKLAFKPGTDTLQCPYCGTANRFETDTAAGIEELDFDTWLETLGKQEPQETQSAVKCATCGAEQTLPPAIAQGQCTFCHATLTSATYAKRLIKPRAVAPFAIDRPHAEERFRGWIGSLWFAPGKLKRYAQTDAGLRALYVPYWTYDCNTASDYSGQRGDDYFEETLVNVTNSRGEAVQETRQVKKTRWSSAAGHVERFHDDVLVLASKSFPPEVNAPLSGWRLDQLVPYQAEYLAGFQAEAYQVGLADGFRTARPVIDAQVADAIRADIGGDHQRIERVDTDYSSVRFKHVLLPLWISSYRYGDRVFRFMINGQTGEVRGERPWSGWKIFFAVLAAIIVLAIAAQLGGSK